MAEKQPHPDDRYARQSFTFRRMTPWQVWSIAGAAIAVTVAMLVYVWA